MDIWEDFLNSLEGRRGKIILYHIVVMPISLIGGICLILQEWNPTYDIVLDTPLRLLSFSLGSIVITSLTAIMSIFFFPLGVVLFMLFVLTVYIILQLRIPGLYEWLVQGSVPTSTMTSVTLYDVFLLIACIPYLLIFGIIMSEGNIFYFRPFKRLILKTHVGRNTGEKIKRFVERDIGNSETLCKNCRKPLRIEAEYPFSEYCSPSCENKQKRSDSRGVVIIGSLFFSLGVIGNMLNNKWPVDPLFRDLYTRTFTMGIVVIMFGIGAYLVWRYERQRGYSTMIYFCPECRKHILRHWTQCAYCGQKVSKAICISKYPGTREAPISEG